MRITFVPLVVAALVGCGTERSSLGFNSTGVSGSTSTELTLRVVDDPASALTLLSLET